MQKKFQPFDALKVPLRGSNLIEASAGTGKTYSIALMVLRLVVEDKAQIQQILLVTFTKAAVAELESRVRLFILEGMKALHHQKEHDSPSTTIDANIVAIISAAIKDKGIASVAQQLKTAVLWLDETSILTIHSFCQNTLHEFAFETKQMFGAEVLPDLSEMATLRLNQFWRTRITTLPLELLQLLEPHLEKEDFFQIIIKQLAGKNYIGLEDPNNASFSEEELSLITENLLQAQQQYDSEKEDLYLYFQEHLSEYEQQINSSTQLTKKFAHVLLQPENLFYFMLAQLASTKVPAYVKNAFSDFRDRVLALQASLEELDEMKIGCIIKLKCVALVEVCEKIAESKQQQNIVTYDDLITQVHRKLVVEENPSLETLLRKKYRAAFIDEFQDTDKLQYEIFQTVFGKQSILFYIGDPKQSIYAFRSSDIYTYFAARTQVDHLYTMNENFRSTPSFIASLNHFFQPTADYDTFHFENADARIDYQTVQSPSGNTKGSLTYKGSPMQDIYIAVGQNKGDNLQLTVNQIAALLYDEDYLLQPLNKEARRILPKDIGILVRTGFEAKDIKEALLKKGILSVTLKADKLLQSAESLDMLYLIHAMNAPSTASIKRALLSNFTGLRTESACRLDSMKALQLFEQYQILWQEDGIFAALTKFSRDFSMADSLLLSGEISERSLTNFYQLAELLHETQHKSNWSAAELISWLERQLHATQPDEDEYLTRMESDQAAVTITTIHSSKGLEYPVVFCPYINSKKKPPSGQELVAYLNEETLNYEFGEAAQLSEEQNAWYEKQQEQERKRLLYVAVTRAVYQCYLFASNHYTTWQGVLELFDLQEKSIIPPLPQPGGIDFQQHHVEEVAKMPVLRPVQVSVLQPYWRKMSFSSLAMKMPYQPKERKYGQEETYDEFIFNTLPAGIKTGDLLHAIFENINFLQEASWQRGIRKVLQVHQPQKAESYLAPLQEMLQHVCHTKLHVGSEEFTLSQVPKAETIQELEFDYLVPNFPLAKLEKFSLAQRPLALNYPQEMSYATIEGMMNGKLDLLFRANEKFYILDWKSNYLGPSVSHYNEEGVHQAMNDGNYHLQYLIYSVAVKKYLHTRMPQANFEEIFGGVLYLFVRGMRQGERSGIFTAAPNFQEIAALEALLSKPTEV